MYYAASRPLTPVPPALSRSKMTPQASSSQGGRPMRNVRFYSDSVQTLALQQNDARCQNRTHAPQQTALFDHLVSAHGACVGEWRRYAVHRLSRR
jgi:hypothetical protein